MREREEQSKLLYQGSSLETYLKVKNSLEGLGISYDTKSKTKTGWLHFFLLIYLRATATVGMNGEHEMVYTIYIKKEDFERLQEQGKIPLFS